MQKRLVQSLIYIGVWARDLHIDKAHTALDIFRFAAFFLIVWEQRDKERDFWLKPSSLGKTFLGILDSKIPLFLDSACDGGIRNSIHKNFIICVQFES